MTQPLNPGQFFESQRAAIAEAAARGGGQAVVEHIRTFDDARLRLVLYTMARQVLVMGEKHERDLDAAVAVADAGIAQVAALLADAPEGQLRADLVRSLHILNFNLAADLADCWPDELGKPALQPERRHFERGLQAAQVLVGDIFAGTLEPRIVANDYWVLGMHQLSLGRLRDAHQSWTKAQQAANEAAALLVRPDGSTPRTSQMLLLLGYRAICNFLLAKEGGQGSRIEAATRMMSTSLYRLGQQAEDPDKAEDALFFIAQLQKVRDKYARGMSP